MKKPCAVGARSKPGANIIDWSNASNMPDVEDYIYLLFTFRSSFDFDYK